MNEKNLIFNIFLTVLLILAWCGILFVSFLLYLMSDMFRFLGNGILIYTTICVYTLSFILPIIFRRRISKHLSLPFLFILSTIFSVVFVGFILCGAKNYISDFSKEKWNNNGRLRVYMIDDLEKNHGVIGKTDEEIVDLLGKPICINDDQNIIYEYYVGESIIDPYGYQIEFENNVAVNTKLFEH